MRTASSLLLLIVGAGLAIADDRSFCQGECAKKYKEETIKSACSSGCSLRGSISDGTRGFIVCHSACASAHNETDTEERRACDFACSLPLTNIVMMKVDYGTGDSAPRVQVVRKEGGNIFDSNIGLGSGFDFLLRPSDINGGALAAGTHREETDKASKEDESAAGYRMPMGVLQNMFKIKTDDEEFNQMQDRLDKLVKSFFDRAHLTSSIASERPQGHDDFSSLFSPSSSVGNEDANGHQILFVAPLEGEEKTDLSHFERSHESSVRRRFPALFQWSVCFVLLIAVLCTAVVAMLMIRQMRVNRYRALRGQTATASVSVPMPLVEAGEMVKKIPIDVDESYPLPSGVPPPAYDQLSVHSKKGGDQQ
ncbi:hypothetical protein PENTCL1PPCAC_7785 [Pristionchus entomophagus]|uniref:Uncharacterized protein n=1 Tax=Pristionchus entomophagus TaxID=358040 RepID=A0AAV5SRD8_9BILA|nr:hypothetical protein PENTCL1PPCAC_7785 [Pristionchus entomophagus]